LKAGAVIVQMVAGRTKLVHDYLDPEHSVVAVAA
jgi:hypothetical protein